MSKYTVYENDLKFKNKRNIDPESAHWEDHVKDKYYNNDFDTLEYRLEECIKNDFIYLDLSHLDLLMLPRSELKKWKYNDKLEHIKYLFINDNNLVKIDDTYDIFNKLEVLDVSNNKLKDITYLPYMLRELSCHNNILLTIPFHKNLHRLDCSMNRINELPKYPNITNLLCYDNDITKLHSYPTATTIVCRNTKLKNIDPQINLQYFDCSNTKLAGKIYDMPNLNHLICNNTAITNVDNLTKLKALEITNSGISKISFINSLKDLMLSVVDSKNIILSSKYIIANYTVQQNNVYIKFK